MLLNPSQYKASLVTTFVTAFKSHTSLHSFKATKTILKSPAQKNYTDAKTESALLKTGCATNTQIAQREKMKLIVIDRFNSTYLATLVPYPMYVMVISQIILQYKVHMES